jgi:pimeloyl-ACP methyl ester carboxylesterase
MDFSEIARTIETMTKIPVSGNIGSTRDRLVYHSTEGGSFTLWSIDPSTGSKLRITPGPVEQFAEPKRDSNLVYFTKDASKGAELHKVYMADATLGGEIMAVDPPPLRIEGLASQGKFVAFTGANKEEMAIYTADSEVPEKRQRVPPTATITDATKRYLAGWGSLTKNPRTCELFVFDLSTGKYSEYTPKQGSVNKIPRLLGARLLFESDYTGKNSLHVYDVESGQVIPAPSSFQDYLSYKAVEYPNYGWTDDGKVWFVGKKDGESKAFVDGREVWTPHGFLSSMTLLGGKAYVIHTSVVQPTRVVEADPGSGKNRVIVDNPPPAKILSRLGKGRLVRFQSFDNRSITALVVDHGSPRRTVVLVHGGPWSEYPNTWGPIISSVAVSGYNVIAPNYRGSTGYGEEFRKLDIGDPGGGDLQDVLSAAKWAKENGVATEVAIMGYSYGGYMTLLALGREPEIFSCGVAGAPVADWKEMHEVSDALYRGFIEELFDRKFELLTDRSPITYAKNVKRPVCIMASQNDTRTPINPVLRYATELAAQSGTFELHVQPDQGHAVGSTQALVDMIFPAIIFLQRQFPSDTPSVMATAGSSSD